MLREAQCAEQHQGKKAGFGNFDNHIVYDELFTSPENGSAPGRQEIHLVNTEIVKLNQSGSNRTQDVGVIIDQGCTRIALDLQLQVVIPRRGAICRIQVEQARAGKARWSSGGEAETHNGRGYHAVVITSSRGELRIIQVIKARPRETVISVWYWCLSQRKVVECDCKQVPETPYFRGMIQTE